MLPINNLCSLNTESSLFTSLSVHSRPKVEYATSCITASSMVNATFGLVIFMASINEHIEMRQNNVAKTILKILMK